MNFFGLMIVIFASVMLFAGNAAGQQKRAYVVVQDSIMTFYYNEYDKPKDSYNVYELNSPDIYRWKTSIKKCVFDDSFKDFKPTNCKNWFMGCYNLAEIVGMNENLNTERVTDMEAMFCFCYALIDIDLSGFNTSNVINMQAMFQSCLHLKKIDLEKFNTTNVTRINSMFDGCSSLNSIDLSGFNTTNVTDMMYLFKDCSSLEDINFSGLNLCNAKYINGMFQGCKTISSLDLSAFNTLNVTDMSQMFQNCNKLKSIFVGEEWNTNNVSNSDQMFSGCGKLYGGKGTSVLESDITDKTYARIDCGATSPGYFTKIGEQPFKLDREAYAILQEGTLTFYYGEFIPKDAYDICGGDLVLPFHSKVQKVVFDDSFRNFKPITCEQWFSECKNLTDIIGMKENLNTEKVKYMGSMFKNCNSLTNIDLKGFNTTNVVDMSGMFAFCFNLETLDLSSFKTNNVTNMNYMFLSCLKLKTIYVGNGWNTVNVSSSSNMFGGCDVLCGEQGSTFKYWGYRDKSYARIDGGIASPGYFTHEDVAQTVIGISIATTPKMEYIIGEDFSIEGGSLCVLFHNGESMIISMSEANISGFVINKIGKQTINVEYCGESVSFDVNVSEREVVAIAISTFPKIEYFLNEELNIDGGVLSVLYNDHTTELVSLEDAVVGGYNKGEIGRQTITIEYYGKTTTFDVSVKEKTAVSLTISQLPKTNYQQGMDLSLDGGTVVVTFDDYSTETLALSSSSVTGYNKNIIGEQTLTVEFWGLTTEFKVTVSAREDINDNQNMDEPTPTTELKSRSNVKIYAYGNFIVVEGVTDDIRIINSFGRVVKTIKPECLRTEIIIQTTGVFIVQTGLKVQKVIIR